jgi:hypothetical protein
VVAEAAGADVVVKASGVGVFDDDLLAGLAAAADHRVGRRRVDGHRGPVGRVDVAVALAVEGVGLVEGDAVADPAPQEVPA